MSDTKSQQAEAQTDLSQPDEVIVAVADERRLHQRFLSATKVLVEIPFVPTMDFGARDFSLGGMRLEFQDETAGKRAFRDNLIQIGSGLTLRFRISLEGERHECRVKAEIVRFTEHGIGVHFGPPKPWQLVKLVEIFAKAYPEPGLGQHQPSASDDAEPPTESGDDNGR